LPLVLLVVLAVCAPSLAQPASPLPPSAPGNPPDIPYLEEQWELLWYLNQDVLWKRCAATAPVTAADRTRAIEALRVACASDFGPERAAALMALAKTGDPAVASLLIAGVDDANLETRRNALLALGVLGDPSAVDVLDATLDEKKLEGDLRLAAAFALGLLRTPDVTAGGASPARAQFERRLEPKAFSAADPRTQQGLAYGAGLSGDHALAPALAKLTKSKAVKKNSSVRAYLLLGLGKLKDRAYADVLFQALTDGRRQRAPERDSRGRRHVLGQRQRRSRASLDETRRPRERRAVATNFANLALGFVGGPDAQRTLAIRTFGDRRSGLDPNTLAPRISLGTKSRVPIAGLALGIARGVDYRGYFERAFRDENDQRVKAAYGLGIGMLGNPDSGKVLFAAFKDTARSAPAHVSRARARIRESTGCARRAVGARRRGNRRRADARVRASVGCARPGQCPAAPARASGARDVRCLAVLDAVRTRTRRRPHGARAGVRDPREPRRRTSAGPHVRSDRDRNDRRRRSAEAPRGHRHAVQLHARPWTLPQHPVDAVTFGPERRSGAEHPSVLRPAGHPGLGFPRPVGGITHEGRAVFLSILSKFP
jgi:HEAT repeat protein